MVGVQGGLPLLDGDVMDIITCSYSGATLEMPSPAWHKWPGHLLAYNEFPACYCGAGSGIGELLVPDWIFGLFRWCGWAILISPACWIHDQDWDLAEPTIEEFTESNDRFQANINALITVANVPGFVKRLARYRACTYRNAVDGPGEAIFWRLKKEQGHDVPEEYL